MTKTTKKIPLPVASTPDVTYAIDDPMYECAAALLMLVTTGKATGMTIKQTMIVAGFPKEITDSDINIHRKRIFRLKANLAKKKPAIETPSVVPIPVVVNVKKPSSTVISGLSEESPTKKMLSKNMPTMGKKRRKTSKQVLQEASDKIKMRTRENEAYHEAVAEWIKLQRIPIRKRIRSSKTLVDDINQKYKTSLSHRTIRRRVNLGISFATPRYGGGATTKLSPEVVQALRKAVITYIQLSNAEMKKKSNGKETVKLLKS